MPRYIISDRGSTFVSKFTKEWYKILSIKGLPTTAYHPQGDGQTERMNQEVEIFLQHFINHRQDDWTDWLSLAEFSIANRESSNTKVSPFYATQGRHPWTGNPIEASDITTNNEAVKDFVMRMDEIHQRIKEASEGAREIMKRRHGTIHKPIQYKEGDKVWLDVRNYTSERPSKKLDHSRYGPFEVIKKHGSSSYELKVPRTWKIHPVFNEALLTRFATPTLAGQRQETIRPPPDIIDNDEQYEIEEILD